MTYDDMMKQCGITVEHNVATAPYVGDPMRIRMVVGGITDENADLYAELHWHLSSPPYSHVDLAPPTPPPTLWLADPDAWAAYAEVEIEPVQDRFIEREMIKL